MLADVPRKTDSFFRPFKWDDARTVRRFATFRYTEGKQLAPPDKRMQPWRQVAWMEA
jgi:hypothetical protein